MPSLPPFKITYKIHEHSFAQSGGSWSFKQMFFHSILPSNPKLETKDALKPLTISNTNTMI